MPSNLHSETTTQNLQMDIKLRLLIRCFFIFFLLFFNAGLTFSQSNYKLDSLFTTLYKNGDFNGCVMVAENGKPIYEKALGFANFENNKPLDNQTMFELASVSKQFTAMAIMQLHQIHKLDYHDNLTKYFPQIPYYDITIDNLLHHTSGIPEFLGWNSKQIDTSRINGNQDVLNSLIKNKPALNFNPGEQLSYSNTNYVLLALIVEKVSGVPFDKYMDEHIFNPLGMSHTKIYHQRSSNKKIKDYAFGNIYDPSKGKFVINDSIAGNKYEYYFDGIAGPYGISSTTEDMLKWDQALYTDKLVTKAEQKLAYVPATLKDGEQATFSGIPYGFGWLIFPEKDYTGKRYIHTGGYPGYMSIIARYPDRGKTIIILTNIWNVVNIFQLNTAVENILFDKPFSIPAATPFKKSVVLNPAQLKAIEGTYALKVAPNVKITISSDATQAYAQVTGQTKAQIYPESELDFFYTIVEAKIKFVKDTTGDIDKLILTQSGRQLEAIKEK
ncbi:serine hydrolase domain-containing protein [Mucilaginibacter sp.]